MQWSEVIAHPLLRDLPFKIELNRFGKLLMSPASNRHGRIQGRLAGLLANRRPDGAIITECSIQTADGVKVADVAWVSDALLAEFGDLTPYPRAPELCVEIVSPSNSRAEIAGKVALYLEAGAAEVWVVYEDRRVEIFSANGPLAASQLAPAVGMELFR